MLPLAVQRFERGSLEVGHERENKNTVARRDHVARYVVAGRRNWLGTARRWRQLFKWQVEYFIEQQQ